MKFSTPVIRNFQNDLSKRWYVEFLFLNPETGKNERQRHFFGSNKKKSVKERMDILRTGRNALVELLNSGWSPYEEVSNIVSLKVAQKLAVSVEEAFEKVLEAKKNTLLYKSYLSYRRPYELFLLFLKKNRVDCSDIKGIDKTVIFEFRNTLNTEKYTNRTKNNHINFLKSLFNDMKLMDLIEKNPCLAVKELATERAVHLAYSQEEKIRILEYLKSEDLAMYQLILFLYYMTIRIGELRKLKVENIDFKNRTITINSYQMVEGRRENWSKNKQNRTLSIPDPFWIELEKMKLDCFLGECFVFGYGMKPNITITGRDTYGKRFKKVLQILNMKAQHTLYSWKHTAADDLLHTDLSLKSIQEHLRHHSITQTEEYANTRGIRKDENFVKNYPKITD